jgi:diguanylate cyclase (GGDEF)-like protein
VLHPLKVSAHRAERELVTLDARDPSRAARSLAPFAAAALLAWLVVPIGSPVDWSEYLISVVLLAVSALLAGLSCVRLLRAEVGQVPASLAFMAAVELLRVSVGGMSSGASALAMIPIFYTALYSRRRGHLHIVLGALALFYLLPELLGGSPMLPHSEYRAGIVMLTVAATIGLTTQTLVARVRNQARNARRREQMLVEVSQAVRGLFDSSDPRLEVCEATRKISNAAVSILLEPAEGGALAATARAGLDGLDVEMVLSADCVHPAHTAFATGLSRVVPGEIESCSAHRELWMACGRPASILYQPVTRSGDVVGVLVVAWPEAVTPASARVTVVTLLATEAAVAIHRADEISALAGMAQTDPLTGLPNRRAWDARLTRAIGEGQPFTIVMLDLDRFKQFNDAHGHPTGDRLLKETAAAWREVLRTEDLVARLGGEEFGMLLFDCDMQSAEDVTERLRELVTHGQTCSVGIARRRPDESLEAVMARADRALYDAKASGRDRACVSA